MRKSAALVLAVLPLLLLQCSASPIRYDQRQDGDQNVDARLQNFFVVVSPTAQLSSSGLSLLDLASKAVPLRLRPQGVVSAAEGLKQREEADQDQPDQEVKEVKSGRSVQSPLNAVAIPAAILQSPLAKLHPEVQALSVQEVLIAQSPVVELRSPPAPAPGAIPMLVAVPVPEVAPAPAPAPALLPMHPAAPGPLGDKQAPAADSAPVAAPVPAAEIIAPEAVVASEAAAAPETAAAPAQPIIAAPSIILAIPEAVAAPDAVAADAAAAPIVAPVEAAAAAVETNQIEPESSKLEFEAPEASKVHLIGTGIEECGPERIRNEEGVCVDAVQRF